MKLSHKITIPLAAFTLIAAGAATTVALQSHAQSTTDSSITQNQTQKQNPMSALVKAIAQKFNLNETDVQQVFDDQHAQMEQQHQQMIANRLAQAVTDGKLTQDQADIITAKAKELEAQREANKDKFQSMTEAERQAAIQQEMTDLKQWATDNNIPQEYLPFEGHGGFGGHARFGHGPKGM